MWADKEVVQLSISEMDVVIVRDDLAQPVMYLPVRADFNETNESAVERAKLVAEALTPPKPDRDGNKRPHRR